MRHDDDRELAANNLAVLRTHDYPILVLDFLRRRRARIPNRSRQVWTRTVGGYIKELHAGSFGQRGCDANDRGKHDAGSKHSMSPKHKYADRPACRRQYGGLKTLPTPTAGHGCHYRKWPFVTSGDVRSGHQSANRLMSTRPSAVPEKHALANARVESGFPKKHAPRKKARIPIHWMRFGRRGHQPPKSTAAVLPPLMTTPTRSPAAGR